MLNAALVVNRYSPQKLVVKARDLCTMAELNKRPQINNFAFIDLETTGLPSDENNKTRITEFSITIIESKHISLGVYPRVRNKLNLCLNPCKIIQPTTTEITGLSNDILENQSRFSSNVVGTINNFLDTQKKPICFVAHNGNKFDYPILRAEIKNAGAGLPEGILCIDSLLCFQDLHRLKEEELQLNSEDAIQAEYNEREEVDAPETKQPTEVRPEFSDGMDDLLCSVFDEYENGTKIKNIQKFLETTPKKQIIRQRNPPTPKPDRNASTSIKRKWTSFKLGEIYKRLTSRNPINSHHAEGDVECLIHCAAHYGEEFVQWANENARLFTDIPPMKPGVRIGM